MRDNGEFVGATFSGYNLRYEFGEYNDIVKVFLAVSILVKELAYFPIGFANELVVFIGQNGSVVDQLVIGLHV